MTIDRLKKRDLTITNQTCQECNTPLNRVNGYQFFWLDSINFAVCVCDNCLAKAKTFGRYENKE